MFLVIAAFFIQPWTVYGGECTSALYSGQSFERAIRTFTPYDKIYLRIDCKDLETGNYTMHVNWVHQREGIVRSDSQEFAMEKRENKRVFFWFKLLRRGPLKSALTNQDFYEGHFGDWTAQTFLNNDLVTQAPFTISY